MRIIASLTFHAAEVSPAPSHDGGAEVQNVNPGPERRQQMQKVCTPDGKAWANYNSCTEQKCNLGARDVRRMMGNDLSYYSSRK